MTGTLSGEPGALPLEKTYNGKLKITFSNGVEDEQIFKLHAHVLRPVILVAPAEHRYGAVHVERWQGKYSEWKSTAVDMFLLNIPFFQIDILVIT